MSYRTSPGGIRLLGAIRRAYICLDNKLGHSVQYPSNISIALWRKAPQISSPEMSLKDTAVCSEQAKPSASGSIPEPYTRSGIPASWCQLAEGCIAWQQPLRSHIQTG